MLKTVTDFFANQPGVQRMQLPTIKSPLTYETILAEIRIMRSDPLVGTGKWTFEEELANHLFKRFKFVDPTKTELAPVPVKAEPEKPATPKVTSQKLDKSQGYDAPLELKTVAK
jgi:hypothetical protein